MGRKSHKSHKEELNTLIVKGDTLSYTTLFRSFYPFIYRLQLLLTLMFHLAWKPKFWEHYSPPLQNLCLSSIKCIRREKFLPSPSCGLPSIASIIASRESTNKLSSNAPPQVCITKVSASIKGGKCEWKPANYIMASTK